MDATTVGWRILEGSDWLGSRPARLRSRLRDMAELRNFERDQPIYLSGDEPNGIFGVVSGSVHLTVPREDGLDFKVHRAGSGYWIGDLALFTHHQRLVSVWAAETTRTIYLPGHRLRRLVDHEPEFYRDFYDLTYENMRLALQVLASFSETNLDRRVTRRLLGEVENRGDPSGWIQISQSELAEMLAISIPTMQRSLGRIQAAGLIKPGYGRIQVLDRNGLLEHCGPEVSF